MPAIIETYELEIEDVETHDLTIETRERREPRRTRPGFWRSLVHKITTHLTPAPSYHVSRPFETPMDRFAREYPSLAPYALAMI